MDTFNIHEAKTHLSKLVERAAKGEPFVIAKAGEPMVKVVPIDASPERTEKPDERRKRRVGFLKEVYAIPDDVKAFGRDEIDEMFDGPRGCGSSPTPS